MSNTKWKVPDDRIGTWMQYLRDNEGKRFSPYLDKRGFITAGYGTKIDNWEWLKRNSTKDLGAAEREEMAKAWKRFSALELTAKDSDGKVRPATDQEKLAAFNVLWQNKERMAGNYDRDDRFWRDRTGVELTDRDGMRFCARRYRTGWMVSPRKSAWRHGIA